MSHAARVITDALTLDDGQLFHTKKGKAREYPAPLAPLADTHGHLTVLRSHDPAMAVARAALAGVRLLVVPIDPVGDCGLDPTDDMPLRSASDLIAFIDDAAELAAGLLGEFADRGLVPPVFEEFPDASGCTEELPLDLRFIAGSHPYNAPWFDDAAEARMRELLAAGRCVGVGEIGLDFGPYSEVAPELQMKIFRKQLLMAHELGLPVELHVRDAAGDAQATAHAMAAELLREVGVPEAGCDLHCFTSGPEVLEPFVELGCRIAFGGAATFAKSDDIRAAAALTPSSLIVTETDSPYMAPVPLRGEECEPAMVAYTASLVADVREAAGVSGREETYRNLWENALDLFSLR